MGSPVGSAVHIQDEVCTGPSVGKVISGDDIDSLAINLDELKKVSACSPLDSELYLITALFTNMPILKFKSHIWRLRFSMPSIILTNLLGNKTLLKRVQKVMVGDL